MINLILSREEKLSQWVKRLHLSVDLETALNAAFKAGQAILSELSVNNHHIAFDGKQNGKGIVTAFDELSESVLKSELSRRSNYSFVGEESGTSANTESRKTWVVDPIDGTTNFAFGYGFYAISIGLLENGQSLAGVVYELHTGDVFFAEKRKGAYKNGEKIRVATAESYGNQPVLFINNGYGAASKERAGLQLQRLAPTISDFRKFGCTAYEITCVAAGYAPAYIGSGAEIWDYAAAVIILEEAGGSVTDWKGEPFDFQSSYIIATNADKSLREKLIEASKDLQKPGTGR